MGMPQIGLGFEEDPGGVDSKRGGPQEKPRRMPRQQSGDPKKITPGGQKTADGSQNLIGIQLGMIKLDGNDPVLKGIPMYFPFDLSGPWAFRGPWALRRPWELWELRRTLGTLVSQ